MRIHPTMSARATTVAALLRLMTQASGSDMPPSDDELSIGRSDDGGLAVLSVVATHGQAE